MSISCLVLILVFLFQIEFVVGTKKSGGDGTSECANIIDAKVIWLGDKGRFKK